MPGPPPDSKETYEAAVASSDLRTGDLQALAVGFLRGAVDVAKLAPRLLAAAEAIGWHRLSCSCKVILFRGFDLHRELLEPKDVATVEALYSEVLEALGTQLDKAAEPSAQWAQASPEQFRASMEDLNVTELDASSTAALLKRLGIDCDWPIKEDKEKLDWEAEAESILWRVREIPVLEAHPVPNRGQTFGHVEWSLRCAGTEASKHGRLILRSGHGYDRKPEGSLKDREEVVQRAQSVEPLVPLVLDGFSREADSEIQALAAVLREAEGLQSLGSEILGEVRLLVDQTPCLSCMGAMAQFRALLPEVKVSCHFVRLSARRRAERDQCLPSVKRESRTYSIYEGVESAGTMTGSEPSGGPRLEGALRTLRLGLRQAGAEEEFCDLLRLEPDPQAVKPSELLPLSLMLPASGAFHALIRLSLKEGRLNEALGLLEFMRRKGVPIFSRTFEDLALNSEMHPRKAMGFIAEMEALGLQASRRLVSAVLTRACRLGGQAREGLGPAILRLRCRQFWRAKHQADAAPEEEASDVPLDERFRPGSSAVGPRAPLLFLQLPNSGAISSCISRTGHLAPRWAKALGIWAALRFYEEDAKTPFRVLLAVAGIIQQEEVMPGSASTSAQRAVVASLRQTGLLERMLTKRALTPEEEAAVRFIEDP